MSCDDDRTLSRGRRVVPAAARCPAGTAARSPCPVPGMPAHGPFPRQEKPTGEAGCGFGMSRPDVAGPGHGVRRRPRAPAAADAVTVVAAVSAGPAFTGADQVDRLREQGGRGARIPGAASIGISLFGRAGATDPPVSHRAAPAPSGPNRPHPVPVGSGRLRPARTRRTGVSPRSRATRGVVRALPLPDAGRGPLPAGGRIVTSSARGTAVRVPTPALIPAPSLPPPHSPHEENHEKTKGRATGRRARSRRGRILTGSRGRPSTGRGNGKVAGNRAKAGAEGARKGTSGEDRTLRTSEGLDHDVRAHRAAGGHSPLRGGPHGVSERTSPGSREGLAMLPGGPHGALWNPGGPYRTGGRTDETAGPGFPGVREPVKKGEPRCNLWW